MAQYCARHFCVIHLCAMKNPFEFGRELGVDEIVDRDAEVAEVVKTIEQGGKLFIIGPRRYGKTSILKAAEDRLQTAGAVVLRYDAESYPSLDLLVNSLVAGAARYLKGVCRADRCTDPQVLLTLASGIELQRDRTRVDRESGGQRHRCY